MMEITLQATLANILNQLASFFSTTTEAIMQNAPYWLAQYGWYTMMCWSPFALFIGAGIGIVIFDVLRWAFEIEMKHPVLVAVALIIISIIICVCICFGQCAIAPEIYGLRAIMHDISSMK